MRTYAYANHSPVESTYLQKCAFYDFITFEEYNLNRYLFKKQERSRDDTMNI